MTDSDLNAIRQRLEYLLHLTERFTVEGQDHARSWRDNGAGHQDGGPEAECPACDQLFGQAATYQQAAKDLEALLAHVTVLTAERDELFTECIESDKQADQELIAQYQASEGWRKRTEAAEAQVHHLTQQLEIAQEDASHHRHCVTCAEDGCSSCGECQRLDEQIAALAGVSAP